MKKIIQTGGPNREQIEGKSSKIEGVGLSSKFKKKNEDQDLTDRALENAPGATIVPPSIGPNGGTIIQSPRSDDEIGGANLLNVPGKPNQEE